MFEAPLILSPKSSPLLSRFPSTCNSVPSHMSPPFTAVDSPFSPSSVDLNDDSLHESEIPPSPHLLLALCQKTLAEVDIAVNSMKSCISDGVSSLNRDFFWCNGFGDSDLHHFDSDSVEPESMASGSEFDVEPLPESEFDVDPLPESEFDLESEVPETQFEELELRHAKKRKVSGGGYGGATSEPASLKAEEREPWVDEMLRLLLPRYFER